MLEEKYKEYVITHDIKEVRNQLYTCLLFDRLQTESFKEYYEFCLEQGISEEELFENDENSYDDIELTEESYNEIVGSLLTKFTKEKIQLLKKIGLKLKGEQEEASENVLLKKEIKQEKYTLWEELESKSYLTLLKEFGILFVEFLKAGGKLILKFFQIIVRTVLIITEKTKTFIKKHRR